MIYYSIFVLMSLSLLFKIKGIETKYVAVFWIIVLSFMTAVRYEVGTDYDSYVQLFSAAPTLGHMLPKTLYIEWGAYLSMVFIKTIFGHVEYWFLFTSLISFTAVYCAIRNLFPQILGEALLVYFSFFFLQNHFNIVRHGVMAAFLWFAFSCIPQKQLTKYLLAMAVAILFHISAVFFVPMYWILNRQFPNYLTIVILVVLFIGGNVLQQYIFSLPFTGEIGEAMTYYTQVYYKGQEVDNTLSFGILVYSFIYLFICFSASRYDSVLNFKLVKNALFFSLCILFLFKGAGVFSERFGGILNISLIFIMPLLVNSYKGTVRHICRFLLILYCVLLLYRNLSSYNMSEGKLQFLPYKTVLF